MTVSVFAPISIGNVSVGFDTLGLAVAPINGDLVGDIVTVEPQSSERLSNELVITGPYANRLPTDPHSNIVWCCLQAFEVALAARQYPRQAVAVTLQKNIPVGSGLGSSACSVVAAFAALNYFYENPFDDMQLLSMMGELEAQISGSLHYDNVAPCFLGGLQLMLNDPQKITQSLPTFGDVYWVMAYPDFMVSTKAAREILPTQYDRKTMITFAQNLAGFVDASHRQDKDLAFSLIKDVVAEPYRSQLLKNYSLAKSELKNIGSLAFGISGSGPTVFCACDDLSIAKNCAVWLEQNYLQSAEGFVHICKVDNQGARRI